MSFARNTSNWGKLGDQVWAAWRVQHRVEARAAQLPLVAWPCVTFQRLSLHNSSFMARCLLLLPGESVVSKRSAVLDFGNVHRSTFSILVIILYELKLQVIHLAYRSIDHRIVIVRRIRDILADLSNSKLRARPRRGTWDHAHSCSYALMLAFLLLFLAGRSRYLS